MFEDLSQNGPPLVFVVAKICPYCDSVTEIKEHKVFTASILATLCHLPHNINLLETFFLCFFHEQHELLFDHCLRKLQYLIQAELDCFGGNFVLGKGSGKKIRISYGLLPNPPSDPSPGMVFFRIKKFTPIFFGN